MEIPILKSISQISDKYEAWFCDIWGVLHNGKTVYREALEACQEFKKTGKSIILITNAPKTRMFVEAKLKELKIPESCYDDIVTSGDVTQELIKQYSKKPLFHLGPEGDESIFEGIDIKFSTKEKAQVILCSGLMDDENETPEIYRDDLKNFVNKNIPMICANPDIQVERGDRLIYCAGALAKLYADLGGVALYAGKPHCKIYEAAFKKLNNIKSGIDPKKVLCIGDGINTDIHGARNNGLDAIFIASNIYVKQKSLNRDLLLELFGQIKEKPIAAQNSLVW